MKNKEILMSYVAGLMDGDGSFSIIKENRKRGPIYSPCIQLSNVFEGMTNFIFDLFGGSVKQKSKQPHARKTQYVWNVRGFESCKSFIEKVIPYLVLKKERAKYMLEFINKFYLSEIDRNRNCFGCFIERDIKECGQDRCYLKMKALNNDCLVADGLVVKQAIKNSDDPIFWSYFSGIIDTEGSFSIRKNKPSCGSKNYKYGPLIQLSMATFETMNYIRRNLSFGNICFPKAITTQRGFVYKLAFGKIDECKFVIEQLIPFLKFKKELALIVLDFCDNYNVVKHCRGGIPEEEIAFRESCYQKVININKLGIINLL